MAEEKIVHYKSTTVTLQRGKKIIEFESRYMPNELRKWIEALDKPLYEGVKLSG